MASPSELWDASLGTEGEDRIIALQRLGDALWATGEHQDALAVFAEVADQIRVTSSTGRWLSQIWLNALRLRELEDLEASNDLLEEGIRVATDETLDQNLGVLRHIRARNMFDQGLLEYARVEFERAMTIHEFCGDDLMQARAKSELATTLEMLGSKVEALNLRLEALRGFELSGEVDEVAEENQAIGVLHQKMDAHSEAIPYLEDAKVGWKFLGRDLEYQASLRLLGASFRVVRRSTEAEHVLRLAISMKSGREQQQEAARAISELAEVYAAQELLNEAEDLRIEANSLLRATGLR